MKGVQCYEVYGGMTLKNHAFSSFNIYICNLRPLDVVQLNISGVSCLHQERTNKAIHMTENVSLHTITVNNIGLCNMSRVK